MEPWLTKLEEGDTDDAWRLFDTRYRRLMLATIRRLVPEHDELMDVYGSVCQALSADSCARLKRYSVAASRASGAATWVVAVVRNLTVDWLRQRDGRRRRSIPSHLSPLQQEIYTEVCLGGHSHVEAYEVIRSRTGASLTFSQFLREVRATHQQSPCPDLTPRRPLRDLSPELSTPALPDPAESADQVRRVAGLLASQPAEVRLAVELFVVERMAAADVARMVGWPNAKTVYNRVSRALAGLRAELERGGLGPGDL